MESQGCFHFSSRGKGIFLSIPVDTDCGFPPLISRKSAAARHLAMRVCPHCREPARTEAVECGQKGRARSGKHQGVCSVVTEREALIVAAEEIFPLFEAEGE